jgi:hypothetical protein
MEEEWGRSALHPKASEAPCKCPADRYTRTSPQIPLRRSAATPAFLYTVMFLAACTRTPSQPLYNDEQEPEPSPAVQEASSTSIRETKNVSYQGILEDAGITTAMQGSHRLSLPGGRFILLESANVDLNAYLGAEVEVFGAIRPTVEAGGIIMRVEQVAYLHASSSSEEQVESSVASSSESEPAPIEQSSSKSSVLPAPKPQSSVRTETQSSSKKSEPTPIDREETPISEALQARIDAMAKENISADRWTRQYCTSHIGFCIPVHKNWYFTSFGTTSSALWHVEVSSEAPEGLGDGPIGVNLYTGSVASKKATDGQVRAQGDLVIGFREWTDGQHFEIIAPAALEEAVRHITKNLTAAPAE